MVCLACGTLSPGDLCRSCRASLAPAPERRPAEGLVVRGVFAHRGAARVLVHRLKYQGIVRAAAPLAEGMAGRLPQATAVLIPVPRVRLRRWRYGVDPARVLAMALSARTGLPVADVLDAGWWVLPRAGRRRSGRTVPRFVLRRPAPGGGVLVDDVVTTGATLAAAAGTIGRPVLGAVTATAAERTISGRVRSDHGRHEVRQ